MVYYAQLHMLPFCFCNILSMQLFYLDTPFLNSNSFIRAYFHTTYLHFSSLVVIQFTHTRVYQAVRIKNGCYFDTNILHLSLAIASASYILQYCTIVLLHSCVYVDRKQSFKRSQGLAFALSASNHTLLQ